MPEKKVGTCIYTTMGILLFSNKHVVFCEFWEDVKQKTSKQDNPNPLIVN